MKYEQIFMHNYEEKIRADERKKAVAGYKNKIIELLCVEDEDYDKPIISPKFLKDYLEQMLMD